VGCAKTMEEANQEVSFGYGGYGRGVCPPVARVVAIQGQACKVVICRDCIVTTQLRLRPSMPVDAANLSWYSFPSFQGHSSPMKVLTSSHPLPLLLGEVHVTYVHASLSSISNASLPKKLRCLVPFSSADPAKSATWLPQTSLIHHLMVARIHAGAIIPAYKRSRSSESASPRPLAEHKHRPLDGIGQIADHQCKPPSHSPKKPPFSRIMKRTL